MNTWLIIIFFIHALAILCVYIEKAKRENKIINILLIVASMLLVIGAVKTGWA